MTANFRFDLNILKKAFSNGPPFRMSAYKIVFKAISSGIVPFLNVRSTWYTDTDLVITIVIVAET
ncbi:hypothetical protein ES703_52766 [subsurface metagenome]